MITLKSMNSKEKTIFLNIFEFNKNNLFFCYRTGLVTVSTVARLDRDTNPHQYSLVITAVDAGFPIPETATTTLYVQITDVNDKPPK